MCVFAGQSCPTLCDPMDCSPSGSSVLLGVPRQERWSGLPCPPPGDLADPRMEPGSPALQADSLPLSHQKSPSTSYAASNTHILCTHSVSGIQPSAKSHRSLICVLITSESRGSRESGVTGAERLSFLDSSDGCLPGRRHCTDSCPNRLVGVCLWRRPPAGIFPGKR